MDNNNNKITLLLKQIAILNDEVERLRCCDRNYILQKRMHQKLHTSITDSSSFLLPSQLQRRNKTQH